MYGGQNMVIININILIKIVLPHKQSQQQPLASGATAAITTHPSCDCNYTRSKCDYKTITAHDVCAFPKNVQLHSETKPCFARNSQKLNTFPNNGIDDLICCQTIPTLSSPIPKLSGHIQSPASTKRAVVQVFVGHSLCLTPKSITW